MLEIKDINVFYGAIQALTNASINVQKGEVVAIIGSNGAGKSTLLRTISGMIRPRTGTMTFEGRNLVTTPAHEIVKLGISHSPEGRRIFTNMTVHENLQLGAYIRKDADIHKDMEDVLDRFPRLRERFKQNAGTMSGGEQQMLAIGRALMSRPELLLLDEPTGGLMEQEVMDLMGLLRRIRDQGVTIMLIEHKMRLVRQVSDRIAVLNNGGLICEGEPGKVLNDERVVEAYLGTADSSAA